MDVNPFEVPHVGPPQPGALTEDEAARQRLLKTEARLTQVGTLWMVAGALEGTLFAMGALTVAVFVVVNPSATGAAETALGGMVYLAVAALRALQAWQGLRLRALEPGGYGLVMALALLGVCVGPCGCVSWAVPFLAVGADARQVLTPEHAALRARTSHMRPETSRFGVLVLGMFVLIPMIAIAIIVALTALGDSLSKNFDEVSSEINGR